jgi:O-antigen/teichoic acid export membrane protein
VVAIVDQGLFAGTNFVVNVYLARHLPQSSYGAFALAQAAYALLASAFGAVLTEPMTVFGAGKYSSRFESYLAALLSASYRISLIASVVTAVAGWVCGRFLAQELGQALFGLAVAVPFLLHALLGRAANYARLRPGASLGGGVLYCVFALLGLLFLEAHDWLTPGSAFFALGAGGFLAATFTIGSLRPRWRGDRIPANQLTEEHWAYGRWALATAATSWVPLNMYYIVLPAWSGLAAGAALKAVMNLAQPALQTLLALTALVLPVLVRRHGSGGRRAVSEAAWRFLVMFAAITIPYLAVVWLVGTSAIDLLYAGKYHSYAAALLWVGLAPVAASAAVILASMQRALERPDRIFWAYCWASAVTLTAGLALTAAWGVSGAAGGFVLSYLVAAVAMLRFWRMDGARSAA